MASRASERAGRGPCCKGWLAILAFCHLPVFAADLSGSFTPLGTTTNISLTSLGTLDWTHWGLNNATDINRKTTLTPLIGPLAAVGSGALIQLTTNPVTVSWSDGTPTLAATNSPTGVAIGGLTNGFVLTVEAGIERRRLLIYAGANSTFTLLEALLSDASAPGYFDDSLGSPASTNGVFVIDFSAGSPGQNLTVRLTTQSLVDSNGLVWLQAAALASNVPPVTTLTSPTNGAKFFHSVAVPLSATASDSDGFIERVEFYQGTNKLGEVPTAPYDFLWDTAVPGTYILTALAIDNDGASYRSAPVMITVLSNFPPSVSLTNPVTLSAYVSPTNITLAATAGDVDGNVIKVEFFAGGAKLGETTNSPYSFIWTNPAVGEYFLSARATDNLGATATSTSVDVFVTQSGGYLAASNAVVSDPVGLDSEGPADWAHWGLYTARSFDHKRGVVSQIPDYSVIGGETAYPYGDNANTYSWSDGTPTLSVTNSSTGVYIAGRQTGFHLQLPAGLGTNSVKVYVGSFAARGRLLAYLSDFSSPVISDSSVDNPGNGPSTVYTINYAAASAGKLLHIRFLTDSLYDSGSGNVTLQAAALDVGNRPPMVAITNPATSTLFVAPANLAISADASDPDGTVTNVEFFRDGVKFGQTNAAPYSLVWSNVPAGRHLLATRATDDRGTTFTSRSVDVFVTIGGGALVASSEFPSAQLDLSAEGSIDWTHWGLAKASSFDHRIDATSHIANASRIGNSPFQRYSDNFTHYSWTNGTPTPSVSSTPTGIFITGLSNGFQVLVPADTSRRRLKVYVGLYGARARFEAALSDSSAPSFVDSSLFNVYGNNYRVYTLDFKAASPTQQLILRHTADQTYDTAFGNVTLQAATFVDLPPARLADPIWDGTSLAFHFPTLSNWSYTVEYSDDLPGTNWLILTNFPGTGLEAWFTNAPTDSPQRFFRVIER